MHWRFWCWSWSSNILPPDRKSQLIVKDPDAGKDWRQEKGTKEDEMVRWHHRLDGHKFAQGPGVGDGQGSLVCCSPWDHKEAGQFVVLFACCCCSVAESCLILVNPMDCSMPGLPVLHPLPEFAQTHVHWLGDAIQPSHPLLSTSPPAFNLSQHQGIFQWVGSSHQMAKVLKLQLQHQSFSWINIQGWFPLGLTDLISLMSKGLSRVFSSSTI